MKLLVGRNTYHEWRCGPNVTATQTTTVNKALYERWKDLGLICRRCTMPRGDVYFLPGNGGGDYHIGTLPDGPCCCGRVGGRRRRVKPSALFNAVAEGLVSDQCFERWKRRRAGRKRRQP